jgi:hypothetical protein
MTIEFMRCPSCNNEHLRDHCESPSCPWKKCRNCNAYGPKSPNPKVPWRSDKKDER